MTTQPRRRQLLSYLVAVGVGLVAGYLVIAIFVFPAGGARPEVTVPNVVGVKYDDAVRALQQAGFKAQQGEVRPNATAPDRTVLQQVPAAGRKEALGTIVILHISGAPGARKTGMGESQPSGRTLALNP